MTEVVLWILIAVSNGGHGAGVSTVIDRFKTKEKCEAARLQMYEFEEPDFSLTKPKSNKAWAKCVRAEVVR